MSSLEPTPVPVKDFSFSFEKITTFDVEVMPGRWMIGFFWRNPETGNFCHITVQDRKELIRQLRNVNLRGHALVGYNSLNYDLYIVQAVLDGNDPYEVSKQIFANQKLRDEGKDPVRLYRHRPENHVDLFGRCKKGLKPSAANLMRPRLKESPYPWDAVLNDEQWKEVEEYNKVDLAHTYNLCRYYGPELASLGEISNELQMDVRSLPSPRVGEQVMLEAYYKERGVYPTKPELPTNAVYFPREGVRRPRTEQAAKWYDEVVGKTHPITYISLGRRRKKVLKFPSATVEIAGRKYKLGAGGIHSIDQPRWCESDDEYEVYSVDVASYYPRLIAEKNISPAALESLGSRTYRQLLDRRMDVKARASSDPDPEARRKYALQADGLKLVLNSTFGKFGESFSLLYDPSAMLAVTVSGQLMLIDLIERLVELPDIEILNGNTDGLYIRVPKNDPRWREVCEQWESDTKMLLEYTQLKRFYCLSQNRYASLDSKDKQKGKGSSVKTTIDPKSSANEFVVADAVMAAFFKDIPPEVTIDGCREILRFTRITDSRAASRAICTDGTNVEPLGRITRWYRSKWSKNKILLEYEAGWRTPPGADHVVLAQNRPDEFPNDIDNDYYYTQARKWIQSVESYNHLDPKFLTDTNGEALHLHNLGLTPCPKNGKWRVPGLNLNVPTYLWDWNRYRTFGTYTGPKVGIIVIDIDDPHKWHTSLLQNGVGGLFTDNSRFEDLTKAIIVAREGIDPKDVAYGKKKGKLIFRFEADKDHPLAKMAYSFWAKSRGIDVFYGKQVPSILGKGDPDTPDYVLHGEELTDIPEWLKNSLIPTKRGPSGTRPAKKKKVELTPLFAGMDDPDSPEGPEFRSDLTDYPGIDLSLFDVEVATSGSSRLPKKSLLPTGTLPKEATIEELCDIAEDLDPMLRGAQWIIKESDINEDGKIAVCRCPHPHDSGSSSYTDMHIGFDSYNVPFALCKHSSCTQIPILSDKLRRLKRTEVWLGKLPDYHLNEMGQAFVDGLLQKKIVVHESPTGSGKSHQIRHVVTDLLRKGHSVIVFVPTIRLCDENVDALKELIPDAFAKDEIAFCFRGGASSDDSHKDEDDNIDNLGYPITENTRIIIATGAQFGRRKFSKYLRGFWSAVNRVDKDGNRVCRDFHIIIDEIGAIIGTSQIDIPLHHRSRRRVHADGQGAAIMPVHECPKNVGDGHCGNCTLHGLNGVKAGVQIKIDGYSCYDPVPIGYGIELPSTVVKEMIFRPLIVDPVKDLGWDPSKEIRVGTSTMAMRVEKFRGVPITPEVRKASSFFIYERDPDNKAHALVEEDPLTTLEHMLSFAIDPVLVREVAMLKTDDEETPIPSAELKAQYEEFKQGKRVNKWDDGVSFPHSACEIPYLRFTDTYAHHYMAKYCRERNVGLLMTGATVSDRDIAIIKSVYGEDVEVVKHKYSNEKIEQVAIVGITGPRQAYSSIMVEDEERRKTLIYQRLEKHGRGVVFVPRKYQAEYVFKQCSPYQRSLCGVFENNQKQWDISTIEKPAWTPNHTILTYSRGALGLGVNVKGTVFLHVDANAYRAIGSFNPATISPEEYTKHQEDERISVLLQNIGRALRGEKGKRVVLFIANADEALIKALAASQAVLEGSEKPPVVVTGEDHQKLIEEADGWLGTGKWVPSAKPEKKRGSGGRPTGSDRTIESITTQLEGFKAMGKTKKQVKDGIHYYRLKGDLQIEIGKIIEAMWSLEK